MYSKLLLKAFAFTLQYKIYRHVGKCNNGHVRPAKTQISLRVRAVWSESSLSALWIANEPEPLQVESEDSAETASSYLSLRMEHVSWGMFYRVAAPE